MKAAANVTLYDYACPANSNAPPVSVVIPLYNYQKCISGCIESAVNQTHTNIEIIVVDDFSTDQSAQQAIQCLQEQTDRIAAARVVSHRRNEGLAASRNTGFALATSDLVFALDADNEIYPRAIERLVEAIQSSQAHAAYSQLEFFDEAQGLGLADIWNPERFISGNYVDAMALVRKTAWATVGGYTKMEVMGWEDYDFWCKFVENNLFGVFVPEVLCRYRVHKTSMLRSESNPRIEKLQDEMTRRHRWLKLQ
jgi:glycosyltransferase involved in cell wall biosynthesis